MTLNTRERPKPWIISISTKDRSFLLSQIPTFHFHQVINGCVWNRLSLGSFTLNRSRKSEICHSGLRQKDYTVWNRSFLHLSWLGTNEKCDTKESLKSPSKGRFEAENNSLRTDGLVHMYQQWGICTCQQKHLTLSVPIVFAETEWDLCQVSKWYFRNHQTFGYYKYPCTNQH